MPTLPTPAVESALRDLQIRTLAKLDGDFAKLVYLASTRNYNSGRYEHDGLAFRFAPDIAEEALAIAHREVFVTLALSPLAEFVQHLEKYIFSGAVEPDKVLATWRDLEAYRVLPPAQEDPLTVAVFLSNVRIALAIVEPTWKNRLHQPPASQPPRPGQ